MWGLHEVLLSVDFQSEDSEEMMDLLLRCFLSGNHIKHDDVSVCVHVQVFNQRCLYIFAVVIKMVSLSCV